MLSRYGQTWKIFGRVRRSLNCLPSQHGNDTPSDVALVSMIYGVPYVLRVHAQRRNRCESASRVRATSQTRQLLNRVTRVASLITRHTCSSRSRVIIACFVSDATGNPRNFAQEKRYARGKFAFSRTNASLASGTCRGISLFWSSCREIADSLLMHKLARCKLARKVRVTSAK